MILIWSFIRDHKKWLSLKTIEPVLRMRSSSLRMVLTGLFVAPDRWEVISWENVIENCVSLFVIHATWQKKQCSCCCCLFCCCSWCYYVLLLIFWLLLQWIVVVAVDAALVVVIVSFAIAVADVAYCVGVARFGTF